MKKQRDDKGDNLILDDPVEMKFQALFFERATTVARRLGLDSFSDLPQKTLEIIALENQRHMHSVTSKPLISPTTFLLGYIDYCQERIRRHYQGVFSVNSVNELPEDEREALAQDYIQLAGGYEYPEVDNEETN